MKFHQNFPSQRLLRSIYRSKSTAAALNTTPSLPSYVLQAPETRITKLPSGIRVATETTNDAAASIKIFINAGTRHAKPGTAQLLHQILMQGTTKRSKEQLDASIQQLGGSVKVELDREFTLFSANVLRKDVESAVKVLSDLVQNPKLDASHLAQARVAVAENITKERDNDKVVYDRLHETAYMDSALGYSLIGKKKDIAIPHLEDLEKYVASYYVAPYIVIAGAGAVDHSELVQMAEQYFKQLPTQTAASALDQAFFVGSDIRIKDDSMPLAHFALAFEAYPSYSDHYFDVKVMESLIGSWSNAGPAGLNSSSKLAQAVSEHGLADSFRAFSTSYSDTGLFGIHAIASKYGLNDLTWFMTEALVRMVHKTNDEEVEVARNQYKTAMLMELDNICSTSTDIGRQVMSKGSRMSLAERFAQSDAVTASSIRRTADDIINDKEHVLAAVGPIHELPDYTFIRRRSHWLRF